MKSVITKVFFLGLSMFLVGCNPNSPNQNIGVATGAVAGGLIGSTIGGGAGQAVAVGAGAVAGALIGGAIGQSMDDADRGRMVGALDRGDRVYWVNPHTRYAYTVVPTRRVVVRGYRVCRRYYTVMRKGGHHQRVYGTACRNPKGRWVTVH